MTTPHPGGAFAAPPPYAGPPPRARRPIDILGIIGVIVAGAVLLPSLLVLAIGFIPEMNAIWWLGIVLIPFLGIGGALAIVLGGIGIPVAVRRRGRYVLSIIAVALGLVALFPFGWLWINSLG